MSGACFVFFPIFVTFVSCAVADNGVPRTNTRRNVPRNTGRNTNVS